MGIKSNLKILFIVFFVAVMVRGAGVVLYPKLLPAPDVFYEYDPIATNILSGKGFVLAHLVLPKDVPICDRGPGYPLFLAAIYRTVGRSFPAVRIIQSVLDGVTVVLVVQMAWMLWANWKRAIIAGLILSFYPLSIYSSNLVAVETVFGFVFFMSVFFFVKGCRKDNLGMYVISGMLLAYSVLIRSTSLSFPLVMGLWLFAFKGIRKRNVFGYACLLLGFAAILMPWSIRNYNVFNEFLLASTNGGTNFYLGSSLNYLKPDAEKMQQSRYKSIIQETTGKDIESPLERDRCYWKLGWRNYVNAWAHNPRDVIKLVFYKTMRFWYATDSGRQQKLLSAMQAALLLASIFGIWGASKRKQIPSEMWLLVLSVFYYWSIFIVMFPLARYTIPIIPMLAILASLNIEKSSIATGSIASLEKPL
jgi:hypothetical protein